MFVDKLGSFYERIELNNKRTKCFLTTLKMHVAQVYMKIWTEFCAICVPKMVRVHTKMRCACAAQNDMRMCSLKCDARAQPKRGAQPKRDAHAQAAQPQMRCACAVQNQMCMRNPKSDV